MFRSKKNYGEEVIWNWGGGVHILLDERRREWTQVIAGMRKVDQLLKRNG